MIHRFLALVATATLLGCGSSTPLSSPSIPLASGDDAPKCDAYTGPALSSLHDYEGSNHEHTSYSDGNPHYLPSDAYKIGKDAGYSWMAMSDHSDELDDGNYVTVHASCDPTQSNFDPTQEDYCFANARPDKLFKWPSTLTQAQASTTPDFLAIRGFEWTSDVYGHINVYFSQNFTNAKDDGGYALTMDTFYNWFSRDPSVPGLAGSASSPVPFGGGADGLATFNHPHDKCSLNGVPAPFAKGVCDWNDYTFIPAADERMFAIEAYNTDNRQDRYQPYIIAALDKGWHLAFTGSEDDHFAHYASEIRPKTVTMATDISEAAFREAWLARRVYALTPGQHLRADVLADHQAPMGSRLSCDTSKGTVNLKVKMIEPDGTPFAGAFHVFTNEGKEIASAAGVGAQFELPVERGVERYYFVRVHGADGTSVAYLAPIWITGK